ncbi:glycine zipper domain-containing protein [Paraburkholderia bannensis]|uniref:glycine zipper domain-containing protein n=1 Tax=Paraburkholderia bannensis TaxID=765414 RepID=UPI002ABD532E|nr:YMGG-like glycine zipper-containing protein [Paraburkholderia bannensis]
MKQLGIGLLLALSSLSLAQQHPAVYPAHGQSAQKQQQDEGACYAWAKQNTGIDPTVAAQPVQTPTGPTGARVAGAARGAAAGAIIGDVSGNSAGHGAAVGATAGAVAGGVRARREHAAQAQAQQQTQGAELATYWRAFGACMQGRGYTVQ